MELNVLYFAHVRERVGLASECLVVSDKATVADAVNVLVERYPTLRELLPVVRVAVNGEFSDAGMQLTDGDELVLIPPVAGGSGIRPVHLTHSPLDDALIHRLRSLAGGPERGAVVCFEGIVRDHARGRQVVGIDYEAYEPMALKQMERIRQSIEDEISGVRVVIHHRLGRLVVGDCAVVVVTSSAHRKEAFQACQKVLERLKADVPIWKHEKGPDGSEWVSDRP